MQTQLSINEMKVLWVVGAAERLATLGLLSPDVPLKLSSDAVDTYMEIDEYRNVLFQNDIEIVQIFKALAESECKVEGILEDLNSIIELILRYKNDRTEIVKFALSHQTL